LNSKRGGNLLIGIADDKRIVGLDRDYLSLGRPGGREQSDADRFQLHLRNLVAAQIGRHISNHSIETAIVPHEEKDVCVVRVSPSPTPVYVGEGRTRAFYLRVGPATQELNVEETVAFCRKRWPRET
jgi:predicted HTH transcriptional regulator